MVVYYNSDMSFLTHYRNAIAFLCITYGSILITSKVYALTWETLSLKGSISLVIEAVTKVFIPLAVTILFLVFVYGIFLYMRAASSGDSKMANIAKARLLYGIIILFAVSSFWGFVYVLRSLFTG